MDPVERSKAQFDAAVRVYREPHKRKEMIESIHRAYGTNGIAETSIKNYFLNVRRLLEGKRYSSKMTTDLVERTLKWIGEEFGTERAKGAALAVILYVEHYLPIPQTAVRKAALAVLAPDYLPSLDMLDLENSKAVAAARSLSAADRAVRLAEADPKPTTRTVLVTVFNRNPYVAVEILFRANGICERCESAAPFTRQRDLSPYLEVHHRLPLSQGGDDTVANAIALCPNCHREAHSGVDRDKFTNLTPKG